MAVDSEKVPKTVGRKCRTVEAFSTANVREFKPRMDAKKEEQPRMDANGHDSEKQKPQINAD